MKHILTLIQIIVSVSLVALIILQAKGVGLGRAWGGGGEFYKSRRGIEKIIFQITIVLALIFLITSIFNLILS
ncbi:preprotein translocase subunit SecG [Candidatus Gottesmanbacteria bacterium RIFCSPLOWO2_01_FULL_39_12b]|uniref:Protein-export membrane protein SecG n=1 Tax=Candidatus Gottesmanbacteria bacterium RIFCSPLOWO2_01_FULL_39_12b TaxID=1798388 RepID=A0A1F6AQC2_9BACT|nr:MAG: preprotein translocase subunit SecG [Candidatus Gottesmanbacteria bacterium RIFCSPLOWO2_01_FULL_39_12b]